MSSPITWDNVLGKLHEIKRIFDKSYKCLNRTPLPSKITQLKHINILACQHNTIANLGRTIYPVLSTEHKLEFENYFTSIKNRLKVLFNKLQVPQEVPTCITKLLDLSIHSLLCSVSSNTDTDSLEDTDTDSLVEQNEINNLSNMTPIEFINTATKLLPEFDGKIENLSKFINAIDLLETIKETHENIAISLIKTKLTHSASTLITTESTIEAIKSKLVASVKYESPQSISARLNTVKQNNKSDSDFAKEIETLSLQLEQAFIADGLTPALAKSYSTQHAVKTIKTNAKSEEVKLLMRAGQFPTVGDAITKFLELGSESSGTLQVNYINKFRNSNVRYRGRGNRSYRGQRSSSNRNYNTRRNGSHSDNRDNNNRNRNYGHNTNYRGRRHNNGNVRYTEASENGDVPQSAQLGNVSN